MYINSRYFIWIPTLFYSGGDKLIFGVSFQTITAYIFGFIIIVFIFAVFANPLKKLLKICMACIAGTVGLIIFNLVGHYIGITIGINPGSILTVGILGIPGFLLLLFLRLYM
ncbi:MAG TPA: SigmaK-factor processing regulatory BofA [Clostridiaceae bacterium]|nr:SigmaK-factor processing regulatory BofA [Clostridiaceae bacterium]